MILYFCPDIAVKSGGVRCLYRHVELLARSGIPAAILHEQTPFKAPDTPDVPLKYLDQPRVLSPGDTVVVPEGSVNIMRGLKDLPVRKFVAALSWVHIFSRLPDHLDWRHFNVERVLAVSPMVADFVRWSMKLPVALLDFAVDPTLYHYDEAAKRPVVSYFTRKAEKVEALKRLLGARDPRFVEAVEWLGCDDLPEADYAARLREASVYLALGEAEALNITVYEAWRCGTLVAGFDAVGLAGTMRGDGPERNCLLAQNGDLFGLAQALEPLLLDLLSGEMSAWRGVIRNGRKLAAPHTPEREERSVLDFWASV